jgi:hypothetical protein
MELHTGAGGNKSDGGSKWILRGHLKPQSSGLVGGGWKCISKFLIEMEANPVPL